MSSALPPNKGTLGFPNNPQSGGPPPPPPPGQLGTYGVTQYSPSPPSSSSLAIRQTKSGGNSPSQKTQLSPGEIQKEKEKILATFQTTVQELRGQVKAAPTKAATIKKIEEEILKVRSKAANQLASLNLRGATISLNESFDALDNILGKKVPMKPSDIAYLPEDDRLEGILRVAPEERFVISENLRNDVLTQCMAALNEPNKREKLITLLGADKNISDKLLTQKLISQLALVKPGVLPPEGWVEKSSDLKKLNTDIKIAVQRDLLNLSLMDCDILRHITLDDIDILAKELSKDKPQIPKFLQTRLTKERPEPAILQALENAFSKDLVWRVEAQKKIQQLLNQRARF